MLSECMFVDDLVLMIATIEGVRNKFIEWKEALREQGFESFFLGACGKPKL